MSIIFQVSGEGGGKPLYRTTSHCIRSIYLKEGFFGFYNGLSASFARQLSYTTIRLGIYNTITDQLATSGNQNQS